MAGFAVSAAAMAGVNVYTTSAATTITTDTIASQQQQLSPRPEILVASSQQQQQQLLLLLLLSEFTITALYPNLQMIDNNDFDSTGFGTLPRPLSIQQHQDVVH
jgi:hypothetical protein